VHGKGRKREKADSYKAHGRTRKYTDLKRYTEKVEKWEKADSYKAHG
jgi:hypothetical protein